MDQQHKERMRINAVVKELELEMAEQDYQNEKRNAAKEFEEKKVGIEIFLLASQTTVLHAGLPERAADRAAGGQAEDD